MMCSALHNHMDSSSLTPSTHCPPPPPPPTPPTRRNECPMAQQQRRKGMSRRHIALWAASLTLSVTSLTIYQLGRSMFVALGGPLALTSYESTARHLGASNQSVEDMFSVVGNDSAILRVNATELGESDDDNSRTIEPNKSDDDESYDPPYNESEAVESPILEAPTPKATSPALIRDVMWGSNHAESVSNTRPFMQSLAAKDIDGDMIDKRMTPAQNLWKNTKTHQQLVQLQAERKATPTKTHQQLMQLHAEHKATPKGIKLTKPATFQKGQKLNRTAFIDIISIGSLTKPQYQSAQEQTFGSHPAVRSFYKINELNDTDATCYSNLTLGNLNRAADFCRQVDGQSYESTLIRQKLRPFQEYRKSTGWLCAQKRPIDGLWAVLQRYKVELPPSYLVIVDDDTYINMNPLVGTLHNAHPPNGHFILGGCIFTLPRELRFTFPYGGYASILTRKVIENLLRPIYCDDMGPDGFTRLACWRLSQNLVGERQFFREGMSVAELMYTYSSELAFTKVNQWKNGVGFCFHSDQALGYFFGFYHVGIPDHRLEKAANNDKLRRTNHFGYVTIGYGNQCENERDMCSDESMICHYQRPSQMTKLYNEVDSATTK